MRLQQPGDARGGGGLDEDALLLREQPVGGEDLPVGDRLDVAAGLVAGVERLLPGSGVADPDGGRDRRGRGDTGAGHDGRGAGGLEAEHARALRRDAVRGVLPVALPVGRDVAGVADGQAVHVGRVAERVAHLEGGGLLAVDAVGVDRVDQRRRVVLRQRAAQVEAVVEVALHLQQLRAVNERLRQLAERDLALGHEDRAGQPALGGVGGGARAGVAGARADDGLGAGLHRLADRHRHAAVLERPGRVGALDLEPDLRADQLGQHAGVDERGAALEQRHDGRVGRDGQAVAVLLDQAAPAGPGARRDGHDRPLPRPRAVLTAAVPRRA